MKQPVDSKFNKKHSTGKTKQKILADLPKRIKGKNKEFVEGYNNAIDDVQKAIKSFTDSNKDDPKGANFS